jgi:hypothetical protein
VWAQNFQILHALWHTIQEAKLFSWPEGGTPLEELARPQDKHILDKFLSVAVPTFKEEDDHYFFPDPVDCERCVVNQILFANQHNLISLFMSLHFEEDADSALSTTDIYTLFLRWLREHRINTVLAVSRTVLIRRLQELGYERCEFGNGTGIYGIRLKERTE